MLEAMKCKSGSGSFFFGCFEFFGEACGGWISGKIRTCSDTKYDVSTKGMEDTIKKQSQNKE